MPEFAATPGAVASFFDALGAGRGALYLRPAGLLSAGEAEAAVEAGHAARLCGGARTFSFCEIMVRRGGETAALMAPVAAVLEWRDSGHPSVSEFDSRFAALTAPRPSFGGAAQARGPGVALMGIINVTPDSFSDGGQWIDPDAAVRHGQALFESGAQILDVGGESTRPGATPVSADEQLRRVIPVVRGLAEIGATVSIDTRDAAVMEAALKEGARIINDVTALSGDARSLDVAAKNGAPVVLMHMQGTPETMQKEPRYENAPLDVFDFLEDRIAACEKAGLKRENIVVDPGIGFGKTKAHNAAILANVGLYHGLGATVMIGVSRKSFVANAGAGEPPERRLPGSLAAALAAVDQGVQMLRVHDVAETRQALAVWDAVHGG